MVRHTHRRRQTKGRRRHTRRTRRTQRGGGLFDFFSSTPNDDDIKNLQQKLNMEQDPIKKAEIQEELSCAQAKQIKDRTVKQIKERGTQGNNIGSSSMGMSNNGMGMGNNNMARNSAGQFQSPNSMFGGRRRRSHRRR